MCCESSALPVDPVNNPNQAAIDKLQVRIHLAFKEISAHILSLKGNG
jgi:hypothetical protein